MGMDGPKKGRPLYIFIYYSSYASSCKPISAMVKKYGWRNFLSPLIFSQLFTDGKACLSRWDGRQVIFEGLPGLGSHGEKPFFLPLSPNFYEPFGKVKVFKV